MPHQVVGVLPSLDALERRFDGRVPDELRRAADAGSRERAQALQAARESALFDRLAARAVRALARLRLDGIRDPAEPRLAAAAHDLALYRRIGVAWQCRATWPGMTAPVAKTGSTAMLRPFAQAG